MYMFGFLKNEKFWCVAAGAAGVIAGEKIIKSKKARDIAVCGLAKGMKLKYDAEEALQSIKDDAEDACYEARRKDESDSKADVTANEE